jgi:ABC-2 type transport system ATP-binding protein
MRMILGLDAPTQGSVTVGGRSYRDLPAPMREVGALLDAKALHGGGRARDHLLCLAQSNGIPGVRPGWPLSWQRSDHPVMALWSVLPT